MSIQQNEIFGGQGHRQKRYLIENLLCNNPSSEYYQVKSLDNQTYLIKLCKNESKYQEVQLERFMAKQFEIHQNLQILLESFEYKSSKSILVYSFPKFFTLSYFKQMKGMNLTKGLKILRDVLQGLSTLHSRGVVFLNLSFDSVFIYKECSARLGNFSKIKNSLLCFEDISIDQSILPPELVNRDWQVINATCIDVWMAGQFLAELCFGIRIEVGVSRRGRRMARFEGLQTVFFKYLFLRMLHPNIELRASCDEILLIICDKYIGEYQRKAKIVSDRVERLNSLAFAECLQNYFTNSLEDLDTLLIHKINFKMWMKPHKIEELYKFIIKKGIHESPENALKIFCLLFTFIVSEPVLESNCRFLQRISDLINDFYFDNNKEHSYLNLHSQTFLKLFNSMISQLILLHSKSLSFVDYENLELDLTYSSPVFSYLNSLLVVLNFCLNHSQPFKDMKILLISYIKEEIISLSSSISELKSFTLSNPVSDCIETMKKLISSSIDNYNQKFIELYLKDSNTEFFSLSNTNSSCFKTYNSRSSATQSEKLNFLQNFFSNLFIDPEKVSEGTLIKSGSSCSVFKGVYKSKPVAVKLLNKDTSDMFKLFHREFESLAKLKHKNIVKFYGAYKKETYRLVFSLCSSVNLYDLLHTYKEIELNDATKFKIAIDICQAMQFVHKKKVIHRDLKSLNILLKYPVVKTGDLIHVKIADFGSSRIFYNVLTENVGTVHWMAPEVINGNDYGLPVDVYSYGVLLWEIFTRDEPYQGLSRLEIMEGVSQGFLSLNLQKIQKNGIKEIIQNCLSFNPAERHNFAYLSFLLKQASSEGLEI